MPDSFRSGFVSIVGRPNVGKSSLLNRFVSNKVAIVSDKPQTTRNAIRGVLHGSDWQMIFIDTPGLHKPKTLLGEHLNQVVLRTLTEVDAIAVVLDASQSFGKGDLFVSQRVATSGTPAVCVINKADLVDPGVLMSQIEKASELANWVEVLTTSAKRGTGLDYVIKSLKDQLPEGPPYYPIDMIGDQPETLIIAELIREKVLDLTKEEVPHSVAVIVDEMGKRDDGDLIDIYASIYAERSSQKGILIGHGGRMLKEIGSRARREIEALLGSKVYLDLRVKVEPHWRRDKYLLERFGY